MYAQVRQRCGRKAAARGAAPRATRSSQRLNGNGAPRESFVTIVTRIMWRGGPGWGVGRGSPPAGHSSSSSGGKNGIELNLKQYRGACGAACSLTLFMRLIACARCTRVRRPLPCLVNANGSLQHCSPKAAASSRICCEGVNVTRCYTRRSIAQHSLV